MTDDHPSARTRRVDTAPRRDDAARRRDHAEIDRLADDVLPVLIGRLAASGLGELEVREDGWRIRLRRPAPPPPRPGEQRPERSERSERPVRPGAAHHPLGEQRPREGDPQAAPPSRPGPGDGNGTGPGTGSWVGPRVARPGMPGAAGGDSGRRKLVATSPAVGIFRPRPDVRPGSRVRAGDRLAAVDLLGVAQDVVAPDDGIVADTLVGPGEGVEYGQDLILLEPAGGSRPHPPGLADDDWPGRRDG